MTTCVAAITDEGKALILVADKMIGVGWVESELEVTKMREIHKDWWLLFAGNDLTPVFDIVDYTKARLKEGEPASAGDIQDAVKAAFAQKRLENAETLYLNPIGWEITRFNHEGNSHLPNFMELQAKIDSYHMEIELLVAGFDAGKACIFSLLGFGESRGLTNRFDIPGFVAVGSGSTGADYMMYYRRLSPKTPIREAVYYALEAKYFGEQASGVGASTDLFVARPGEKLIQLDDDKTIEEKLIPICSSLEPKDLRARDRQTLNDLPELRAFPKLEMPKKTKRKKPELVIKTIPIKKTRKKPA
jgi:20S proteasome alpha/beta subunit